MRDAQYLAILRKGVEAWNEWRDKFPDVQPNLSDANLSKKDLSGANLSGVKLRNANLQGADLSDSDLSGADLRNARLTDANLAGAGLTEANLRGANLKRANLSVATLSRVDLSKADLTEADLSEANLRKANLSGADLSRAELFCTLLDSANLSGAKLIGAKLNEAIVCGANLSKADLRGADLSRADLLRTNLTGANLTEADLSFAQLSNSILEKANLTSCRVHGTSAWNLKIDKAIQSDLIITRADESTVTVDDLEVSQFIYLMLNNQKIRNVIDTVTSKAVLILGRFKKERMRVLTALRKNLRQRGYLPIIFDFSPSSNRDLTETITLLARMSRFIIVDLSEPKSVPQELTAIIPDLPSVPVQPIIVASETEYAMFKHWNRYPWVLPVQRYRKVDDLIAILPKKIIPTAEAKVRELTKV